MKKTILALLALSVLVFAVGPGFVERAVDPSKGNAAVAIPEHAVQVAPGVFSLGTAVHEGKVVEGYAIVRYKDAKGKPSGCNNDGVCQGWESAPCGDCPGGDPGDDTSSCYAFLAKGAKWKAVEPYVINPMNSEGLNETELVDNFALDASKWDDAALSDILGEGVVTAGPLVADTTSPDSVNEVYFGSIADEGAIAITIVWGIFGGAPKNRELVEWDMVFDQTDFDWSMSGDPGRMDFENIATHELGHSAGMADLYTLECSEETMYGYASNGETKKSDLNAGDITGIRALYN